MRDSHDLMYILEALDGHDLIFLKKKAADLKQTDGEGWAIGELIDRYVEYWRKEGFK